MSGIDKIRQAKKLLQEARQDQTCSLCKDELDTIVKATEQSEIKLRSMGSMVDEMESKGILDADEKLQEKLKVPSSRPIRHFNEMTGGDGLGISEVIADIMQVAEDVKETRTIVEIIQGAPDYIAENMPDPADIISIKHVPKLPKLPPFPEISQ